MPEPDLQTQHETSAIATLQSLIVAFVLAMTFRGFVTEGFVIPTGSMAPTLMGQHLLIESEETGYDFAIDAPQTSSSRVINDPMLGPRSNLGLQTRAMRARMGDRILVLKTLYPFSQPNRFDVVVFKNPTDPDGDSENYIKRLVGLPNEAIWLLDGDVFVAPASRCDDFGAYQIQRKPEFVQRAVWQPVYASEYIPIDPAGLLTPFVCPWSGDRWDTAGRSYRCDVATPTSIRWDATAWPITDKTPYNMLRRRLVQLQNVADVRVAAGVVPDQPGLQTSLLLRARGQVFEFSIGGGLAAMRYGPQEGAWTASQVTAIDDPVAGRVMEVEFWHVDQSLSMFVDGRRIGEPLLYDWLPEQRVEAAIGQPLQDTLAPEVDFSRLFPGPVQIEWRFEGSPVTLHRVEVDRDLFYLAPRFDGSAQGVRIGAQKIANPDPPGYEELVAIGSPGFGTHPEKPAVLGPDQFFMLGDNSPASSDSRLWGSPHPYVAEQIDPSPFVVNRKLLLGRAWVVYFPAPYPLKDGWPGVVPNFGKLRFIR